FAREFEAPFAQAVVIDLRVTALPRYTLYSLARGVLALAISYLFALGFGWAAAKSRTAERLLLPLLDILQSIPVLGFLPGLVLGLMSLFPTRNMGLELAAILMIFTAQAWNLALSFYNSLKSLPDPLRDACRVAGWRASRTFWQLGVPAAAPGLVWDGVASMAGGLGGEVSAGRNRRRREHRVVVDAGLPPPGAVAPTCEAVPTAHLPHGAAGDAAVRAPVAGRYPGDPARTAACSGEPDHPQSRGVTVRRGRRRRGAGGPVATVAAARTAGAHRVGAAGVLGGVDLRPRHGGGGALHGVGAPGRRGDRPLAPAGASAPARDPGRRVVSGADAISHRDLAIRADRGGARDRRRGAD